MDEQSQHHPTEDHPIGDDPQKPPPQLTPQPVPNAAPIPSPEGDTLVNEAMARVTDVQARYSDWLMKKPHVVGIAVGLRKRVGFLAEPSQLCLVVMVEKLIPPEQLPPEDRIPEEIEGVPVDVQETGAFLAF
jgi:hypothetical protein